MSNLTRARIAQDINKGIIDVPEDLKDEVIFIDEAGADAMLEEQEDEEEIEDK